MSVQRARAVLCFLLVSVGCKPQSDGNVAPDARATPDAALHAGGDLAPTPDAGDVVSGASPAWKPGPAVIAEGTVDGAALRTRTHARIAADKSAVTLLEGGSVLELGQHACEAAVPKRDKDTPILIKPNIGGFEWFKDPATNNGDDGVHGRTTDSEFVRGIVRCLKARGHRRITIAEGFAHTHAEWTRLVRVSGYDAMARAEGVALVAMDDDGVFDVEGDQPGKPLKILGMESSHVTTLLMPKILAEHLDHGLYISAPKIKAHRFGVFSVAIKGMQGTVMLSDAAPAFNQKWRMHKELSAALKLLGPSPAAGKKAYLEALQIFSERISDVLELEAPHVVLAEGAPAMGGDGFAHRWPSAESVAIAGTNPILVDRVAAAYLGLWNNADLARELGGHKTSPLLETAAQRFGVDIAHPIVRGNGAALLDKPRPVHFVSMSNFTIHSDAQPAERAPTLSKAAAATPDADASASAALPTAQATRVEASTLRIDGEIDAAWEKIPTVTFDTDWSGEVTPVKTKARFAYSTEALYALWELESAHLNVDATRPLDAERLKLWEEDCVEMFVGPDPAQRAHYFEIEIGPLGHFLDLEIDRSTKKSDVAWSSRPQIATHVDRAAAKVTIEVAVRAKEIVAALAPGSALPFALYRMEAKPPRRYLAWSPTRTTKPDFHVPAAFGTLRLAR